MQRDRSMREKMKMRGASRQERLVLCLCGLLVMLTYARAFFGTEITDEAYYISDALAMVQGNIPFAYNNFSYGTGSAFLLIPQVFLYDLLVPDHHGLVLFTRLSFVTFRMVVLFLVYCTLQKHTKRSSALLAVCIPARSTTTATTRFLWCCACWWVFGSMTPWSMAAGMAR